MLNSLYWSPYVGSSADIIDKAKGQLEWLENQLELAKSQGQKVMLAGHIPAGYVVNTLRLQLRINYNIFRGRYISLSWFLKVP